MGNVYEERFRVCTWDVDRADRLTMAAAYNYCQEVAGNHATELGVGSEFMQANGIVWILSRMSAVLESRPRSGTRVTTRTWPRGTERLFAVRDYELEDEAGAVFGRGRSAWLIVDLASYRPRRPESLLAGIPANENRDSLLDGARAVEATEGLQPAGDRAVAYSDLDSNGHMNNARYVQWIQDVLDPDSLAEAQSMRLDIQYIAELRLGAVAGMYTGPLENGDPGHLTSPWSSRWAIEGRTAGNDKAASFRAQLSLK